MANQSPDSFSFYPSQTYLDKNQAPEKIPLGAVDALAYSQAVAEHHGLLDPETTKYYLPSAITEGRWDDFGVNQVAVNQRNTPKPEWNQIQAVRDKVMTEAYKQGKVSKESYLKGYKKYNYADEDIPGIKQLNQLMNSEQYWDSSKVPDRVNKVRNAADKLGFSGYSTEIRPTNGGFGKFDMYYPEESRMDLMSPDTWRTNAAHKTLALVNKIDESGKTGLELWKKFNGAGPDADRYAKRLTEAYNMMDHPANKDMANAYNNMVKRYRLGFQQQGAKR